MTAACAESAVIEQQSRQTTEKKSVDKASQDFPYEKEFVGSDEKIQCNSEQQVIQPKGVTGGCDNERIADDTERPGTLAQDKTRFKDTPHSSERNDNTNIPIVQNIDAKSLQRSMNDLKIQSQGDEADASRQARRNSTSKINFSPYNETSADRDTVHDEEKKLPCVALGELRADPVFTLGKSEEDSTESTNFYNEDSLKKFTIESVNTPKEQLREPQILVNNGGCVSKMWTHLKKSSDIRQNSCQDDNDRGINVDNELCKSKSKLNFYEAVRAGDVKRIRSLLASGVVKNLDEPDWNVSGDPPLLIAATNHSLPIVSSLLSSGCDSSVRSPRGETALHRVILNGNPGNVSSLVAELLKYDCPPGVKEAGGGLTALHMLTRQFAYTQGSKSPQYDFEGALQTLDILAKAGPINAKDHQGRSALHILAASTTFDNNNKTEIESLINTLLAAGADPALKNDRGETPLHECLECGALNTAFLLIPHTPVGITSRYGETPLHIAARKNYMNMVTRLLEHGEDPSVQDAGGNTPLHLASARGFHQSVSLLVTSALAQLEKVNSDDLTALQVAAESGFVNAVRILLKAGADPSHMIDYCTTTPHRHPDISILIDHELTRRRQLAA